MIQRTLLIVLTCLFHLVWTSKVLFLIPGAMKSNLNIFGSVSEALADGGHEVTFVSPLKFRPRSPLIRVVELKNGMNEYIAQLGSTFSGNTMTGSEEVVDHSPRQCIAGLEEVKDNILKEDFDVLLLSPYLSECVLLVHYLKQIPYIYVSQNTILLYHNEVMGAPDFPSFSSTYLQSFSHPMTFYQRLINAWDNLWLYDYYSSSVVYGMERVCRESGWCPPDMPPFSELQKNASIALINSIQALEEPPRPMSPSVVYIGGIHIKKPADPLPKVIQEFMDGAEHGVIYFSLGSLLQTEDMPVEHLNTFLNVFKSLKQRVLWKWHNNTIEGQSTNIMQSPWMPQQSILAHPKLKLFISHGGVFSVQEATYSGVPLLGLPLHGDQFRNMIAVENQGWGKTIAWSELSVERLQEQISSLLSNSSVNKICARRSALMRDRQTDARDDVRYWVEHVIRHKGAKHLQTPIASMSWMALYNIDVYVAAAAAILSTTLLLIWILIKFLKWIMGVARSNGKKKKE